MNQRIIIAGGSGTLGSLLATELVRAGYEVVVLSRNPSKAKRLPGGVNVVLWDANTVQAWGALIEGAYALVNLAGESIGIPPIPWTALRKKRISASRVNAGKALVAAIESVKFMPRVLVQSSAVGYYGLHDDEIVTEHDEAGRDFLARVAVEWEASTAQVESLGVRHVVIRTGLPLTTRGGVLPYLSLPFRFFVGGPIGSGKQWMPWIHIADLIGAMLFIINNESAKGVFNLCAPNPVTNAELSRAIGRALHRPSWLRVPAFAMRPAWGRWQRLSCSAVSG